MGQGQKQMTSKAGTTSRLADSDAKFLKVRKITPAELEEPNTSKRPSALGPSGRNLQKTTGQIPPEGPKPKIMDRAAAQVLAERHAAEMEFEATRERWKS